MLPGVVNTNLFRYMPLRTNRFVWFALRPFIWLLMKTPKSGAQTIIYCCVAIEEEGVSGKMYRCVFNSYGLFLFCSSIFMCSSILNNRINSVCKNMLHTNLFK